MQSTFTEWTEFRVKLLEEDGATQEYIRGFRDYVEEQPEDHESVIGDPFGAWDYSAGYGQARYEIGPVETQAVVIREDGRVLTWAA
jgi:hypothetical protein